MFPLFLDLADRRVLVVGGGRVATRRVLSLLQQDADVVVVAPWASEELQRLELAQAIRWERRSYKPGDLDGVWLAVAATDVAAVNDSIAADADTARVWCVRSDDAQKSPAWMAATGTFDDISVAVSAGGDPRRALLVRDGVLEQLERGVLESPRRRSTPGGRVTLVGAGPGAGLITVAGLAALRAADVVVTDRLVDRSLLTHLGDQVEVIDAGKAPHRHALTQEQINATIVEHALAGRNVVRLKGGDPFVFGRGGEEVIACESAGVDVTVIPGVTSAIAAPSIAGIPVTHRGVATQFTVVSAPSHHDFSHLATVGGTLVFLMGVAALPRIVEGLASGGLGPATPLAFIESAYLPGQRVTVSTLGAAIADARNVGVQNPAVIIVGSVVGALQPAPTA